MRKAHPPQPRYRELHEKPPLLPSNFEQTINALIDELRQLITQLSKPGDKKPTKQRSMSQTELPRKIRSSD